MIPKLELYVRQSGLCCYCEQAMLMTGDMAASRFASLYGLTRRQALKRRASYEHLIRRVDGGTNQRHNIVLACEGCNSKRQGTNWVEHKGRMMKQAAAHNTKVS